MEKPPSRLRPMVAALCVVVVLLACGHTPQPVRLSTAPAESLRLTLRFTDALVPSAHVIVGVILQTSAGTEVELTGGQSLTVNGQHEGVLSRVLNATTHEFIVPRPPAGGQYTVIYTDERGQQTKVVAPAPQRDLTITSPAAHARVAIPKPGGQLMMRYTVPSLSLPTSPLSHPLDMRIDAAAQGHCRVAINDQIPASAAGCISARSSQPDPTGSAVITEEPGPPEVGFGNLAPGPGALYLDVYVQGPLPAAGFASAQVYYTDYATIPITWV